LKKREKNTGQSVRSSSRRKMRGEKVVEIKMEGEVDLHRLIVDADHLPLIQGGDLPLHIGVAGHHLLTEVVDHHLPVGLEGEMIGMVTDMGVRLSLLQSRYLLMTLFSLAKDKSII